MDGIYLSKLVSCSSAACFSESGYFCFKFGTFRERVNYCDFTTLHDRRRAVSEDYKVWTEKTTFHGFPDLPLESRNTIYDYPLADHHKPQVNCIREHNLWFVSNWALFRFLLTDGAKIVKTLAIGRNLFCDTPVDGHMSEARIEIRQAMPNWTKTMIVFKDFRKEERLFRDKIPSFRELSCKRRRVFGAYPG